MLRKIVSYSVEGEVFVSGSVVCGDERLYFPVEPFGAGVGMSVLEVV